MARHSGVGARLASLALAVALVAVCIGIARSPNAADAMRRVIAVPVTAIVAPLGRAARLHHANHGLSSIAEDVFRNHIEPLHIGH